MVRSLNAKCGAVSDALAWHLDLPGYHAIDLAMLEPVLAAHIAHLRERDFEDQAAHRILAAQR